MCLVFCSGVHVDVITSVAILHSQDGATVLHIAAAKGHLEMVKYLSPKFGQRRFDKNNTGETCLDRAIAKKKHNVVDYLVQEAGFVHQQ